MSQASVRSLPWDCRTHCWRYQMKQVWFFDSVSFDVIIRKWPILYRILNFLPSWNHCQILDMRFWTTPSSFGTSDSVHHHSKRPKIIPNKKSSKCVFCIINVWLYHWVVYRKFVNNFTFFHCSLNSPFVHSVPSVFFCDLHINHEELKIILQVKFLLRVWFLCDSELSIMYVHECKV